MEDMKDTKRMRLQFRVLRVLRVFRGLISPNSRPCLKSASDNVIDEAARLFLSHSSAIIHRWVGSFGEDNDQNLYITTLGGDIFPFTPTAVSVPEPSAIIAHAFAGTYAGRRRRCRL